LAPDWSDNEGRNNACTDHSAVGACLNISKIAGVRKRANIKFESLELLMDPDSATPARDMINELGEASAIPKAPPASLMASRILHAPLDDGKAPTGVGEQKRRAPTMWP
jgi:hypothetical protein